MKKVVNVRIMVYGLVQGMCTVWCKLHERFGAKYLEAVFVCLRFYGQVNVIKVMSSWSVNIHCSRAL